MKKFSQFRVVKYGKIPKTKKPLSPSQKCWKIPVKWEYSMLSPALNCSEHSFVRDKCDSKSQKDDQRLSGGTELTKIWHFGVSYFIFRRGICFSGTLTYNQWHCANRHVVIPNVVTCYKDLCKLQLIGYQTVYILKCICF